jgi:hypothetical protein
VTRLLAAALIASALSHWGPRIGAHGGEGPPRDVHPVDQSSPGSTLPDPREAEVFSEALERAAKGEWQGLHLLTRCPSSRRLDALEVFGSGVAVWNSARQFRLPVEEIRRILSVLKDAGFGAMPPAYGGEPGSLKHSPKVPKAGAEVTCQISLELDGEVKTVVQLRKGDQSREFRDLASAVLELSRSHAQHGVSPTGLEDALARVARGELAPELLSLSIQRKPMGGQRGEGRHLTLRRQTAETRPMTETAATTEVHRRQLAAEEVRSLAELLRRCDFAGMPANLWSETYTDLDVSVMRWRKSIQARQFAGMGPGDRGAQQKAFDLLLEGLTELEKGITKESPSGPGAASSQSGARRKMAPPTPGMVPSSRTRP